MKQTGSLPKVNPPSTKTKTRKLNSSRTNLVEKEQEKPLQRLKSNNEI